MKITTIIKQDFNDLKEGYIVELYGKDYSFETLEHATNFIEVIVETLRFESWIDTDKVIRSRSIWYTSLRGKAFKATIYNKNETKRGLV